MAWVTILASRYSVNAPASTDLFTDIVGDLSYLYQNQNAPSMTVGSPNIVNGSFELDVNATVQPTGWNFVAGPGGSGQVTNAQYNDGAQSYGASQPGGGSGNTGGTLTGPYNQSTLSQQYYPVSPSASYLLKFMLKCNRTDIQNSVTVYWYTNTYVANSSTPILTLATGSSPTSWTSYAFTVTPLSGSYFCTIQFNLGSNSSTPPGATGNIYVDGVSMSLRPAFSEITSYTSNSTFTVPSGVYYVQVEFFFNSSASGGYFYYSKVIISVKPGDTFTNNFNALLQLQGGPNTLYSGNSTTYAYNTNTNMNYVVAGVFAESAIIFTY
jgi:hypothetical protein